MGGGGMKKSMPMQKMMMMPMSASAPMMGGGAEDAFMSAFMDSDDDLMEGAEEEAGCMFASPVASAMSAPPPPMMAMKRSRGSSMTFKPKVGTANAARVSRGSMVSGRRHGAALRVVRLEGPSRRAGRRLYEGGADGEECDGHLGEAHYAAVCAAGGAEHGDGR